MEAGKTQTKANSTFAMTVLGHDPSFTTQTDYLISYLKFSFISMLLARSLSAITPFHFPALYFVMLFSLNSLIAKACLSFKALERPICERGFSKRKRASCEFHWLLRAERCMLHHLHSFCCPKGTTTSQSPDLTNSQLFPSGMQEMKGKVMGHTRKPPFNFCGDFLDLPSLLCIMEASLV